VGSDQGTGELIVGGLPLSVDDVAWALRNRETVLRMCDQGDAEDSLLEYTRQMWPVLEPGRPFVTGWAIEAVMEHLEAVTKGHIKRLLINVPPGFMKSLGTNVFWPSWEWGPRSKPWLRYITASYSEGLTFRDNDKMRTLIKSAPYQQFWGNQKGLMTNGLREPCSWVTDKALPCDCGARFHMRPDRDAIGIFENNRTGWKLATSVGGTGTGARGDRFIIDDPHSVFTVESEAIRDNTLRWATEVVSTRKNDQDSVFVIIMQRVHERDVSGLFIEGLLGFTHLCIPMRFEEGHPHRWWGMNHACVAEETTAGTDGDEDHEATEPTVAHVATCPQYGKGDPRTEEGELAFPERFPAHEVDATEKAMSLWGGDYAVAGQHAQRPTPRGGGSIKREDFRFVTAAEAANWGGRIVRAWDFAGTKKKRSPYSVGVLMRMSYDARLVVLDVVREKTEPDELEALLKATAIKDGKQIAISYPQDPGQAGKHQVLAFAKLLAGWDFTYTVESGDKETRFRPFAAQVGAHNVYLVRAPWNTPYMAELCAMPKGQYKDQGDASSRAFEYLIGTPDDSLLGAAPRVYDT
jgi:predicted phage terminase large subunit-like protein